MHNKTQERVRSLIGDATVLREQMMHPGPDREWLLSVAWIRFHADQILQNEKVKVLTVGGVKVLTVEEHVGRMSTAC